MTKAKLLNLILVTIGIICPFFLFPFGVVGLLAVGIGDLARHHPWRYIVLAGFVPIGFYLSGPVGFISVLAVLIRNRKGFKRNASSILKFLFLLLLLIINLYVIACVCAQYGLLPRRCASRIICGILCIIGNIIFIPARYLLALLGISM
jgi:hypothetical protein